jgi:hypothetical protein
MGAGSARADVGGADIAVIRAGVVVVDMDATCCRVAGVISADVSVIAS